MTVPDLKSHEKSIKIGLRTYKHFLIPQKWYFVFKTSDKLGPRELSINRKILTWTDRTSTNINTIFRYKCPLQYCYKRTRASSRQQLRYYHNFQLHKQKERADGYRMFTFLISIWRSAHIVICTAAWLGNLKVLILLSASWPVHTPWL